IAYSPPIGSRAASGKIGGVASPGGSWRRAGIILDPTVMANVDAAAIAQHALRLGLLTEGQLEEARDEAGARNPDVDALLLALERKGHLTPWQSTKLKN